MTAMVDTTLRTAPKLWRSPLNRQYTRRNRDAGFTLTTICIVLFEPLISSALDLEPPFRINQLFPITLLLLGIALRPRHLRPAVWKHWPLAGLALLSTTEYCALAMNLTPEVQKAARSLVINFFELALFAVFLSIQDKSTLSRLRRKIPVLLSSLSIFLCVLVLQAIIAGKSFDSVTLRIGFGRDHPATLGYLSAVLAVAHFYFSFARYRSVVARITSSVALVAMMATIFLSQTRGAWIAFGLAITAIIILQKKWIPALVIGFGFAFIIATPFFTIRSAAETRNLRLDDWRTFRDVGSGRFGFWSMFLQEARSVSPLVGGGTGHAYQTSLNRSDLLDAFGRPTYVNVHNDFLLMYIDGGFLGCLFLAVFLLHLVSRSELTPSLAVGLIVVALVCSCVDNFIAMNIVPLVLVFLNNAAVDSKRKLPHQALLPNYLASTN